MTYIIYYFLNINSISLPKINNIFTKNEKKIGEIRKPDNVFMEVKQENNKNANEFKIKYIESFPNLINSNKNEYVKNFENIFSMLKRYLNILSDEINLDIIIGKLVEFENNATKDEKINFKNFILKNKQNNLQDPSFIESYTNLRTYFMIKKSQDFKNKRLLNISSIIKDNFQDFILLAKEEHNENFNKMLTKLIRIIDLYKNNSRDFESFN